MPPLALLFDFDGVLADTENHHVAAWQRTFASLGWELSDASCSRAMELDDRVFLAEVFREEKVEGGDVEGWVRRKQDLTVAMLRDSPRLYPGVAELVRAVRPRARLGVVSTTWRENIQTVLEAAGLADAFEVVVGKEDVSAVKPDPEPYALALSRLGVAAQDAVALEDCASGLEAARGAGVRAIAVGHRLPNGGWVGSAEYVADLTDTEGLLGLLGFGPAHDTDRRS
jgi:HAD superfamily hydrolase (TIGR01509 family)